MEARRKKISCTNGIVDGRMGFPENSSRREYVRDLDFDGQGLAAVCLLSWRGVIWA